jgi:hypothetical protein
MDRISIQTGLSVEYINKIIHKKRVYDMTFYTLFVLYIFYILFGFSQMTHHARAVSMKEWGIKIISGLVILLLLYIIYLSFWKIICGPGYHIINIINSAPG